MRALWPLGIAVAMLRAAAMSSDGTAVGLEEQVEGERHALWRAIGQYEQHLHELHVLADENIDFAESRVLLERARVEPLSVLPYERLRQRALERRTREAGGVEREPQGGAQSVISFGVEVRHLPLFKQLQSAPKFVSTAAWLLARDELSFSRAFDRAVELHNALSLEEDGGSSNAGKRAASPWPTVVSQALSPSEAAAAAFGREPLIAGQETAQDATLGAIWFMARDFAEERHWKRAMARVLAREAAGAVRESAGAFSYLPTRAIYEGIVRGTIPVHEPAQAGCFGGRRRGGIALQARRSCDRIGKRPLSTEEGSTLPPAILEPLEEDATTRWLIVSWSQVEEAFLLAISHVASPNSSMALAAILNGTFHGGRNVRTASQVYSHLQQVIDRSNHRRGVYAGHDCKRHMERSILMNSALTKLIVSKATISTKKLSTVAHASHEAAARKANQSISKLFTPQELAMRRMQRTRVLSDSTGAIYVSVRGSSSMRGCW